MLEQLLARRRQRGEADPGARPRRARRHRLQPHAPPADDPPGDRGDLMPRLSRAPTWADVLEDNAAGPAHGAPARRAAPRLRDGGARVLPAARALGARRRAAADSGRQAGGAPPRRRPGRDGADRARGAAEALSLRAGGRGGRGPGLVRRSGRRRAGGLGAGALPCGRARAAGAGRAGVSRAGRARPCARGPDRGGADRRGAEPRRRSGPGSSTCARTCSAVRSTTSARSRSPDWRRRGSPSSGRSTSTSWRGSSGCRVPVRR